MRMKKITALLLAAALTITGIYIPADSKKAYASEIELTDNAASSNVQESAQASATGAETIKYVRSAKELVSALNGTTVSAANVQIRMETPYYDTKDIGYELQVGDVDLSKGMVLPEKRSVTLDMTYNSLTLSSNIIQSKESYLKLVVPASSSLTVTGVGEDGDASELPFEIENHGTLLIKGRVTVNPHQGNGIKNTGKVTLEQDASIDSAYRTTDLENTAALNNQGGTVFININTFITAANSDSYGNSAIINKDGKVTLECGSVMNPGKAAAGNAILNQGKSAELEIRGGSNVGIDCVYSSGGNGIANDGGKVTIQEATRKKGNMDSLPIDIFGEKNGILSYNGGSVTLYSGYIRSGASEIGAAISTTPYIVDYLGDSVSEGSIKMLGGEVESQNGNKAAIAYSGTSLPVLVGGCVKGNQGAVVKYASKGTPAKVEEFQFVNVKKETVNAYYPATDADPAIPFTEIVDGMSPDAMQTVSYDGVSVTNFAQLQDALAKGGKIKLENDIDVTSNISLIDGTTLYMNGSILKFTEVDLQLTIPKDAKVNMTGGEWGTGAVTFLKIPEKSAGIVNLGTLSMNNVRVGTQSTDLSLVGRDLVQNSGTMHLTDVTVDCRGNGKSIEEPVIGVHNNKEGKLYIDGNSVIAHVGNKFGNAVFNEGNLELKGYQGLDDPAGLRTINSSGVSDCSVRNTGIAIMDNNTSISSSGKDGIAVKNQGSFIMKSGYVQALCGDSEDLHSYAFAYDGDHLPQLIGGRVEGAYHTNNSVEYKNVSKGSAVAQITNWNTMETQMGSFLNKDGKVTSGLNSSLILNGIPNADAEVSADSYLLMEKGEIISKLPSLFSYSYKYSTSNNVIFSSTSENVVSVSKNSEGKWVASAVGIGMTMLRMELKEEGISDYVRVEVVEDRDILKSEDYQGSLLQNNFLYNVYQKKINIPLEWHLKSSYDITSGDSELDPMDTIEPESIILESQDPDFSKYFESSSNLKYANRNKEYSFDLTARTESDRTYNYLVSSDIKDFRDISVKLVANINGRTELIDAGTFDILMDDKEPTFEYRQITLNSAYIPESYYEYNDEFIQQNLADLPEYCKQGKCAVMSIAYPNGFTSPANITKSDQIYTLGYTGKPTNKNYLISAQVREANYNGYFEAKIPVKVINEKPKADVTAKKVEVTSTTEDSSDIMFTVCSNTKEGVATVSKVEVVGNSDFAVVNSTLNGVNFTTPQNKKFVHDTENAASFYLQPRKTIKKAEKVTLKFTYKGVRGNSDTQISKKSAGEPASYFTTTTVNIVPRDLKKATMKLVDKTALMIAQNKTNSTGKKVYDQRPVYFQTTPSNYEGGYFAVSSLNGTGLEAGKVWKEKDGEYFFWLYAKENIKPGKQKISVIWYDKDGKQLGKPLQVPVTIAKSSELTIPDKNVKMDFNDINKMSAKVKWKKTSDYLTLESLNPNFDVMNITDSSFILKASRQAIDNGGILPGMTYAVDVRTINTYGDKKTETLQVKVEDIKTIKVVAFGAQLYKNAPGQQCMIYFDTQKPAYGMSIAKVEITDANTPFEVRAVYQAGEEYNEYQSMVNGQEALWSIAFKNNQYNSKLTGQQKVNLKITYRNGKEATTQTTVFIQ